MKKVLVLGGKGFVGRFLALCVKEQGGEPLVYDLGQSEDELLSFYSQADYVIDAHGLNRSEDSSEFFRVNVEETIRYALLAKERKIPYLFLSSIQAGNGTPYGESKLRAEEELEKLGDKGIRYVRLSNVFGPTCRPGYNSVIATWADAAARRKVDEIALNPLSKETMIPLLYVGDLAEAVVSALTHSGFANLQKGIDGLVGKVSLESVWKLFVHFASLEENRDPLLSLSSFGIPPSILERLYGTYLFALGKPLLLIPVVHRDVRGSFSELVKGGFGGEAQVSWNTVNPFHEKGGHYHHHKIERFTFLEGGMRLFLKPVFQEGAWEGASFGTEGLCSFDIPPFLSHSFRNQTNKAQGVVIWCSEPFDSRSPDTYAS